MKAWNFITGSFKMMRHYSRTFWLIAIPIFILTLAGDFIIEWISTEQFTALSSNQLSTAFWLLASMLLWLIFSFIAGSIFAVIWHRQALLNEPLHYSTSIITRRPVWNYFATLILILLIGMGLYFGFVVIGSLVVGFIGSLFNSRSGFIVLVTIVFIIGLCFFIWLLVFMQRISIILPAKAVGKPEKIGAALKATKGDFWFFLRLMLLTLLVAIIIMIPILIYSYIDLMSAMNGQSIPSPSRSPVWLTLYSSATSTVLAVFQIGILTLLYSHFLRNE